MIHCYGVFNRLAGTEKALKDEREVHKKVLTELEAAKDNAAITQAEKEEVLRADLKIKEENKALKTERASVVKMLDAEKARRESLEKELQAAKEALESVEADTIANFKETADFQRLLKPVFVEGFNFCKTKCAEAFPEIDFSQIQARQQ